MLGINLGLGFWHFLTHPSEPGYGLLKAEAIDSSALQSPEALNSKPLHPDP